MPVLPTWTKSLILPVSENNTGVSQAKASKQTKPKVSDLEGIITKFDAL